MEWTELVVTAARADAQTAEAVATAVCDGGLYIEDYLDLESGVHEIAHVDLIDEELLAKPRDEVKIHLYVSPQHNAADVVQRLQSMMLAAGVHVQLASASLRQEDWENAWKQYYHAMDIGSRLAIVPSWEQYDNSQNRAVLLIDPGMAFGTGTHKTTEFCLRILEKYIKGGESVLDVGCGSGILAIAALLLGAEQALGIDIDPYAVKNAAENAQRNRVQQRLELKQGNLAEMVSGKYDVVCANIVADAIIKLAADAAQRLAEGGIFVASGVIDERRDEVYAALINAGLSVEEELAAEGWVAFVCKGAA